MNSLLRNGLLCVLVVGCGLLTSCVDSQAALGDANQTNSSTRNSSTISRESEKDSPEMDIAGLANEFWKKGHKARIQRVVDGDTVILDFEADLKTTTARLIGINTPEVKSGYTFEECFGPQASARLKQLVEKEADVYVLTDTEPLDIYDRLLVYLFRSSDGKFINELMLEEGYAYTLSISPNDRFKQKFASVTSEARTNSRGLWNACKDYE